VQDESLKEQMVKVRESMDEEMLKAGAGIWNGVWYGMVISTWIWGFVLFDTMASVEGVGKGLCVFVGMVACPVMFYFLFTGLKRCNIHGLVRENQEVSNRTTLVEMKGSFITANPLRDDDDDDSLLSTN
jgi:hypothetical protein